MNDTLNTHFDSPLQSNNREKNSGVRSEEVPVRHRRSVFGVFELPVHQNIIEPNSKLPHRTLAKSSSLGSRSNYVNLFVHLEFGRPDPLVVPWFWSARSSREFKHSTSNRNHWNWKGMNPPAKFSSDFCTTWGDCMPSARRTILITQICPYLCFNTTVIKSV